MEIWKDIGVIKGVNYTGYYQASTVGRIRSVDRYTNHWHGGKIFVKGMMLKQHISKSGYYRIPLHKKIIYPHCNRKDKKKSFNVITKWGIIVVV